MDRDAFDRSLIGRNVRLGRTIRGHSQADLAKLAGLSLSTVQHIEWGRPVHRRSVLKVCEALEASLDSIRGLQQDVLTQDVPFVMFRSATAVWTSGPESRLKVPEDNLERIQDPKERLRLGQLGFVPIFVTTPSFIMPRGPGLVLIELFGRFTEPLNAMIYRDALLSCVSGRVQVSVAGKVLRMEEGDVMGYRTEDLLAMEPEGGSTLPVRMTWTGATRIGDVSVEPGKRVRRRPAGVTRQRV